MKKLASNDIEFLFCEIKSVFLRKKVINYLMQKDDDEIKKIVNRLKNKKKLELLPYDFCDKYNLKNYKMDLDNGLLYVMHNGKRLYFSTKYNSKYRAQRYYKNILLEQDEESPHRYLSSNINFSKNAILLDIGGAEGVFSLDLIDLVKKAYIFECDPKWSVALKNTFSNYKSKVEIIEKYVTDNSKDNNITIDEFLNLKHLENEELIIKMDIEGAEESALKGAKNLLQYNDNVKWLICTYHQKNSEKDIKDIFKNYNIEMSNGYMIYYYDYSLSEPYIRKGVLRAYK